MDHLKLQSVLILQPDMVVIVPTRYVGTQVLTTAWLETCGQVLVQQANWINSKCQSLSMLCWGHSTVKNRSTFGSTSICGVLAIDTEQIQVLYCPTGYIDGNFSDGATKLYLLSPKFFVLHFRLEDHTRGQQVYTSSWVTLCTHRGAGISHIADTLDKARYFVLGLIVAVDHKPLLKLLGDRSLGDISNSRLRNLKEKTLQYRFQMIHIPGVRNKATDTLSRNPTGDSHPSNYPVTLQVIPTPPSIP